MENNLTDTEIVAKLIDLANEFFNRNTPEGGYRVTINRDNLVGRINLLMCDHQNLKDRLCALVK